MAVDLRALLEESGAILTGHFILTSGRHSDTYFEKFRILEQPHVLSVLCSELIDKFKIECPNEMLTAVAGPTTGGIIIAFEVARQLGLPAVYVETENGIKTLRRGKTLPPNSKILIVDDVLTTGTSLIETQGAIEAAGADVAAFGVLIDRAQEGLSLSRPLVSSYKVTAQSYAEDEIPDWLRQIPAVKPGTRK
ncbi:MAG TPA: orotate phosphoribosyltransferase [Fimbriimonadaceae bacterium]|nr:orotate phosphoribosyltransferase [Fimbriimonadaceae bacterium]